MEEVKDDEDNNTQKYQRHVANIFGLKHNCIHEEYSKPIKIFNSGDPEEVNKNFIETLEEYAINSYKLIQSNKDVKILFIEVMKNQTIINLDHALNVKKILTTVTLRRSHIMTI